MMSAIGVLLVLGAGSSGLRVELSPLSGTNQLLRKEVPYATVTYESVAVPAIIFGEGSAERFELRPRGGDWNDCPVNPDNTKDAPQVFHVGRGLEAGTPQQHYIGRVDHICPEITDRTGTFEIRVVYVEQGRQVASASQLFEVRDPIGSDAEALSVLEKTGNSVDQRSFVRRFPSSPYSAPFIGARRPGSPVPDFRRWSAELERSVPRAERIAEASLLQKFVNGNPGHLFAEGVRTQLVALAAANGDLSLLRTNVGELERAGSKSAVRARAFLSSLEGGR